MRSLGFFHRRLYADDDPPPPMLVESTTASGGVSTESHGPASLRTSLVRSAVLALGLVAAAGAVVWSFGSPSEADGSQAITLGAAASGAAPKVGNAAPGFRLMTLDDGAMDLEGLRGRPVWITFWASWCPPCRAESPELAAAFERHAADGLVVIAVDVGEDPDTVAGYVAKAGLPYPVALDRSTALAAQYRVRGLPTHFFVDAGGVLRAIKIGPMGTEEIERKLATIAVD